MSNQLIATADIHTLFIAVSEPIETKNQEHFFKYHIEKNGLSYTPNLKLYSYYLPNCQHYFLAFFSSDCKTSIIEPQVLQMLVGSKTKASTNYTLFICNTFFALFHHRHLCFFKTINQTVQEEHIVHFLQKSCQITIDTIEHITQERFLELQDKYTNHLKNNKAFLFKNHHRLTKTKYLFLCTITLIVFSIATVYFTSYLKEKNALKVELVTLIPQKNSLSHEVVKLLSKLEKQQFIFRSFQFLHNSMTLTILHQHQKELIDFVQQNSAVIKRLDFSEQEGLYELVAFIKLR
jgi:hypothetical protein